MFKLYAGIEKDGKIFNRFEFKEIEGGLRKALNIKEANYVRLMFKFMQSSIAELKDKDGNTLEMTADLFGSMFFIDGFAIGRAAQKHFTGKDKPIFDEFLQCFKCSSGKYKHFIHVRESWDDLINKGFIDEIFLDPDSEDHNFSQVRWSYELESGLDLQGQNYTTVNNQLINFDQMLDITENPELETEDDLQNAVCDAEIISIDGLSEKEFNMVKRTARPGKFLDRYIKTDDDWVIIEKAKPKVGLIGEYRVVKCDTCRQPVTGYDLKNFFFFLTPKSNRNSST